MGFFGNIMKKILEPPAPGTTLSDMEMATSRYEGDRERHERRQNFSSSMESLKKPQRDGIRQDATLSAKNRSAMVTSSSQEGYKTAQ